MGCDIHLLRDKPISTEIGIERKIVALRTMDIPSEILKAFCPCGNGSLAKHKSVYQ